MEELPHLGRPLRVIGRYALYGKLAAGGMATVHFGRLLGPAGFSRTVAIKRLHPQFAKDPEFVAMFLDEARLAARIQHPNVVATVDVVAMAEELFLVMDYIRGESFSRLLKASRKKKVDVPLGIVASVATGMLHGLHAAHEAKDEQGRPLAVVHRDVSPQNVLVGVDGVPRVLDFGVAKAAARIQVTRDGQMKGKLSYMAPEQLKGQGVDRRTDVFAAAIVLWEALTGRRLFDAEQPQEVLRMIISEDIPPPSAVVPSIPRGVDAVVMKALTRDVTQRYQTAREFAIALEDATHIASSREVGEWVERVAGDTLQHREQAVAEIEAISSISDVSALSAPVLGITSTLVGQPPPPPPPKAADWDDGPTRIFDSSAAVEAGLDKATQIQVPKPASQDRRSAVPGAVPKAARVPSRRPPPKPPSAPPEPRMFPPPDPPAAAVSRRPPLPPRAAKPAVASPRALSPEKTDSGPVSVRTSPGAPSAKRASLRPPESGNVARPARSLPPKLPQVASFDDENEKTIVRDGPSDGGGFDDENEKTIVKDTDALPTSSPFFSPKGQQPPPAWDDEGESTTVLDRSGDELAEAAERLSKPPRLEIPVPRPAAGAPPPGPSTVILADHTNPAMLRPQPAPWVLATAWLSGPAASSRRLGIVASVAGLLVAVALSLALGKHPPAPAAVPVSEVPHAESPRPVATAAPSPPEPRGIDPSMLPAAPPDDEPAPRGGAKPDPEGLTKAIAHEAKLVTASLASAAPAASAPSAAAPVPTEEAKVAAATTPADDDLASPYEKGGARTARPKAEAPPLAAPKPEPEAPKPVVEAPKAPAKAPAQKSASGPCAQPFTIDENGIKRIKPECL